MVVLQGRPSFKIYAKNEGFIPCCMQVCVTDVPVADVSPVFFTALSRDWSSHEEEEGHHFFALPSQMTMAPGSDS